MDYFIAPKASFDATADAIRVKTGSQEAITWGQDGFAEAIEDTSLWEDALITGDYPFVEYKNDRITSVGTAVFMNVPANTKIALPNVTIITSNSTWNGGTARDNMKDLYLPKLETLNQSIQYRNYIKYMYFPSLKGSVGTERLRYWRRVETDVVFPLLTGYRGIGAFGNIGDLSTNKTINLYFPSLTSGSGSNIFDTCVNTELIDLGNVNFIGTKTFIKCYRLQKLILRKSNALVTLNNTDAFTSTPFEGYNSLSGTVYIPEVLYNHLGDGTSLDYQSATNWSTMYSGGYLSFAKIEGSAYEDLDYDALIAPSKALAEAWLNPTGGAA